MPRRPALFPLAVTLLAVLACAGGPEEEREAPSAAIPPQEPPSPEAEYATVALGMPDACEASTRIYFRCHLQGGDVVTVCGNDVGQDLWALFVLEPSDGGRPVLYPPPDNPDADPLHLETRQYDHAMGPALSFEVKDLTWELSQVEGDSPAADFHAFTGLSLLRGGSPVDQKRCMEVESTNWTFLERVLHPISP